MHVMFIHQNFPAQFRFIAPRLVSEFGWKCTFVTEKADAVALKGVEKIVYKSRGAATLANHVCTRTFENQVGQAHGVYETLKGRPDVRPDLIVAHSGFGSSLFLPYLYDAPIINFFEFFYKPLGGDLGYRPETPVSEVQLLRLRTRNAMILLDLHNCDCGWTPTFYQRDYFPREFHDRIQVIFDGIDTDVYYRKPNPWRRFPGLKGEVRIPPEKKIVTYVARGFEMMRGFDIFMKCAKIICERCPDVVFVVVGADTVHYGSDMRYFKDKTFRHHVINQDNYDLSRFIFTGYVQPDTLADILSISDLHIYLTMPFIASWSLVNAMACGAIVLASDQICVREYIEPGKNGLLTDFFDYEAMAAKAMDVLNNLDVYRPLSQAAMQTVTDKYSLAVAIPRIKELFERTAAHPRQPSVRAELLVRPGSIPGYSPEDDPDLDVQRIEAAHDGGSIAMPMPGKTVPRSAPPPDITGLEGRDAAAAMLRHLCDTSGDIPQWVQAVQNFKGPPGDLQRIGAMQHPLDLARLLQRVRQWKPRKVFDLSDCDGGLEYLWTRVAGDNATIICASPPGQPISDDRVWFLQAMARAKQRIACIRDARDWADLAAKVDDLRGGATSDSGKFDFIFMNGLRPFADVRGNFKHYRNRVRRGGLFAWDGINAIGADETNNGGDKLWTEVRPLYPARAEYLAGVSAARGGIAMIKIE